MKKRILIILLAVMVLAGMMGCAAKSAQDYASSTYEMGGMAEPAAAPRVDTEQSLIFDSDEMVMEDSAEYEKSASGNGISDGMDSDTVNITNDRKLIFRAYYSIETTEFDSDYAFIMAKMNEVGGYPQNTSVYGTKPEEYGDSGRYSEMTLRIPIDSFDTFIASLEGVGNVLSKSQSTDDVTSEYFDVETRIRVLNSQLDRLEELKATATETEDLLIIQREITDVIYQIENYQGRKKQLDDLIDYTTVSINLNEVNEISTITEGELGLGQKIVKGFKNVGQAMIRFFEGLIILIAGGAPAWVPVGLVIWLVIWLVKRGKKKKAKAAKTDTKTKK